MFEAAPEAVLRGSQDRLVEIKQMDDAVDLLQAGVVDYLRRLEREELSSEVTEEAQHLLAAAIYLENVGDIIETNLVALGRERLRQKVQVSDETGEALDTLYQRVNVALQTSVLAVAENDAPLAVRVIGMKAEIEERANSALDRIGRRLLVDEPGRVPAFRIETDVVGQLKRIYYLAKRIAKTIQGAAQSEEGENGVDQFA
jgi:phosphate:Na+ symporter